MTRVPELTEEQSTRLRSIVRRELVSAVPKQLDLAPMLGISQSGLSKFLDGAPAGYTIAIRAAMLLGRSIEDVLGLEKLNTLVDPQQRRYPTRIYAARAAYLEGVPLARIRAILTTSLKHSGDPGAAAWMKLMRSEELVKPGSGEGTKWAIDRVRTRLKKKKKARTTGR